MENKNYTYYEPLAKILADNISSKVAIRFMAMSPSWFGEKHKQEEGYYPLTVLLEGVFIPLVERTENIIEDLSRSLHFYRHNDSTFVTAFSKLLYGFGADASEGIYEDCPDFAQVFKTLMEVDLKRGEVDIMVEELEKKQAA